MTLPPIVYCHHASCPGVEFRVVSVLKPSALRPFQIVTWFRLWDSDWSAEMLSHPLLPVVTSVSSTFSPSRLAQRTLNAAPIAANGLFDLSPWTAQNCSMAASSVFLFLIELLLREQSGLLRYCSQLFWTGKRERPQATSLWAFTGTFSRSFSVNRSMWKQSNTAN